MDLCSSFYTALTGMNVQQTQVDVIGNNLANANTVGFKASRAMFSTQFSQVVSVGSSPSATSRGTNPMQIGMGATVGSTVPTFTQGSLQTTGTASDLAIQGSGMFCLDDGGGDTLYTRNGSFYLDSNSTLVNGDGYRVQGYQVDSDYNIVQGAVGDLSIPLGDLRAAEETTMAALAGNLNSAGVVGSQGSVLTSQALTDGNGGPAAADATLLTNLYDGTTQLLTAGDVITLTGHKGSRQLAAETLTVAAGETLADLMTFLNGALGINRSTGVPGTPGASVSAGGEIVIRGNYGEDNALVVQAGDLTSSGSTGSPLSFSVSQTANGESVHTSFVAYDSLGQEVQIGLTAVLETLAVTGNTFRIYADSADDTDADICVGTATLTFDQQGQLSSSSGTSVEIDRDGTGAATPMTVTLDVSTMTGLASTVSQVGVTEQDGAPEGALTSFSFDMDGKIQGTFDNGLTRELGQVALARFVNPQGLVAAGDTLYRTGPNSGLAILTAPGTMGVGQIAAGAVELANTDMSQSFVDLMLASAGFTASSRLITTANQMLAEILAATR